MSPRALEARIEEPSIADFGDVLQHFSGSITVREAAQGPSNDRPSEEWPRL
jgi:hypothetical protein